MKTEKQYAGIGDYVESDGLQNAEASKTFARRY